MTLSVESVSAARAHLWEAGFRPVPIINWDAKGPSPGKRPLGDNWRESALKDPPFCVTIPAVPFALNTGILADDRELAASMLDDEITALDWRHHAVRQDMIEAVARHLANNPDNQIAAALAAADIARAANVPPEMIDAAFNIALWRAKRRA